MLAQHEAALRGLRLLFLDCGLRDEWNLHFGARIFARELTERGIRHTHEEFDDGHMQITYRYETSLRRLATALTDGSPPEA
jgi:enterochelin esterase family protein